MGSAVDIGALRGVIELKDEYTSTLDLTSIALSKFSKEHKQSMTAIIEGGGLVAATFTAIAATVVALGERGSDINDVNETLEHFSGGAKAAANNMAALRAGTKGTVDDFALAKDAAHLLSANVRLTAEDFGILGQASFVLQNRGLGGTKEQMDLVSDAMITGKTKALAHALGVVEVTNAEEDFAKKLGITVAELSATGLAESRRIAIMGMLKSAVKDAGQQELDFGEKIEKAKTMVVNWADEVASAVAKSPAFAAGMQVIEDAVSAAFGGDSQESVKMVVTFLENAVIGMTYVGQAAVEMARVVNVAWSGVKVIVLGTELVVSTFVDMFLSAVTTIADAAAKLHIIDPKTVAEIADVRDQVRGLGNDLAKQTAEAFAGVVGQSEFDKSLDKVSGTLFNVRDAMNAAQVASANGEKQTNATAEAGKGLAAQNGKTSESFINRQKVEENVWKVESKSIEETTKLWNEYFQIRASSEGTSFDASRAKIEQWRNDQIATIDYTAKNWTELYKSINAVADEKLKAVGSDWDTLRDKSIEGMQAQANAALADYNKMMTSGLTYTRDVLDAQLQKYRDLQDKARGFGEAGDAAHKALTASAQQQNIVVDSLAQGWDKVAAGVDKTKVNVQMLDGEMVSLAEAQKRFEQGSSFSYDLSSKEGIAQYKKMNPAATITWSDDQIIAYVKKGGTLQGLISTGVINPYAGMGRGFAEGGTVDIEVGERGREVVRVPLGSQVMPNSMVGNGMGGGDVYNTFHVNGTAEESARKIGTILMQQLKYSRKFGAA